MSDETCYQKEEKDSVEERGYGEEKDSAEGRGYGGERGCGEERDSGEEKDYVALIPCAPVDRDYLEETREIFSKLRGEMVHLKNRMGDLEALITAGKERIKREEGVHPEEKRGEKAVRLGRIEGEKAVSPVKPLALELAPELFPNPDFPFAREIQGRLETLRQEMERQLGLKVPEITIRRNDLLDPGVYEIKVFEILKGCGELSLDRLMLLAPSDFLSEIDGKEVFEPIYNHPAKWIPVEDAADFAGAGIMMIEPVSVVVSHFSFILGRFGYELIGRQEVQDLLDSIQETHPALNREIQRLGITLGDIAGVLKNLLREGVSIRNFPLVLEGIADNFYKGVSPEDLLRPVRETMGSAICGSLADECGCIDVIALSMTAEKTIERSIRQKDGRPVLAMDVEKGRKLVEGIREKCAEAETGGIRPVIIASSKIRHSLKRLLARPCPDVTVLSYDEIPPEAEINLVGEISQI